MPRSKRWSASDIPDFTGKVVVVTGANSGIGFEAARELARAGASTVLACRSPERGQSALDELRADLPDAQAELMALDLASLASIERFADEFASRHSRLDVLANNAGIMTVPQLTPTEDGFESQVGTNHLGHFALTGRLLPLLLQTPGARVVTVSSLGHRRGAVDLANLLYDQGGYSPWGAYARSKLANLLFTYELQRRFEQAGADASALAAHPGFSSTNLALHGSFVAVKRLAANLLFQGADKGALPTLRAAADPEARGGQYYGPGGFQELGGRPVVVPSSADSHDEATARRLWELSESLTGVSFDGLAS